MSWMLEEGKGCLVWSLVVGCLMFCGGMSCASAQLLDCLPPTPAWGVSAQHRWGRRCGTVCHRSRAGLAPRHVGSICSCRRALLFSLCSRPKVTRNPCSELAPCKGMCSIKSHAPWEEPSLY